MKPLISIALFVLLAACGGTEKHGGGGAPPDPNQQDDLATAPAFAAVFEAVLRPRCVDCHGVGGSASHVPLETYEDAFAVRDLIDSVVNRGSPRVMPPSRFGPLTPEQKTLLNRWLKAGAPPLASTFHEFARPLSRLDRQRLPLDSFATSRTS